MRDVEVLRTYRCAMMELTMLERQLERCGHSGAPREAPARSGDMPSGTNNIVAAQWQHYDGLAQLLDRKRRELESIGLRFEEIMSSVSDMRLRLILRSYYAMGMTDEEIAADMDMSTRRINMLRNGYLRSLDLPEAA